MLLDGSSLADGALPPAAALAQAFSLPATLVRVIPKADSHFRELFPEEPAQGREASAHAYLETLAQSLKE